MPWEGDLRSSGVPKGPLISVCVRRPIPARQEAVVGGVRRHLYKIYCGPSCEAEGAEEDESVKEDRVMCAHSLTHGTLREGEPDSRFEDEGSRLAESVTTRMGCLQADGVLSRPPARDQSPVVCSSHCDESNNFTYNFPTIFWGSGVVRIFSSRWSLLFCRNQLVVAFLSSWFLCILLLVGRILVCPCNGSDTYTRALFHCNSECLCSF